LDGVALALTGLAALALMRLKWGVMPVIGLCALAGLLLRLSGLA
jgi:chromate transporter